jgi:outer membrane protein assembly factor BamC
LRGFSLLLLLLSIAGCGWYNDDKGIFVNREDDYIDTVERRPLIIPSDLEEEQVQDPLPLPPANTILNAEFYPEEPPRPDAIFASDNRDEVRIQRLGSRRWLVVPEGATTVWPKVRQFLAENGIRIAWENPRVGRIDTQWLEIGDGNYRDVVRSVISDMRQEVGISRGKDRVLLQVEQGLRERSSEIHLRYQNTGLDPNAQDEIGDLNSVPSQALEIETELLNEVGAYIASKVSEQSVSRVAQVISAGVKSEVTRDSSGEPVLALRLDYDRAWATIAQALNRANVEVLELDQQVGTYHVLIPDDVFTGGTSGWLDGLFGGGREYDLLLRFKKTGDNRYYVSVADPTGEPVERALSQEVLTMIREFSS